MTVADALGNALLHVYHEDQANAAMHCAAVRFSPITFRLAEALAGLHDLGPPVAPHVPSAFYADQLAEVMAARGRYSEDPGR